MTSGTHLHKIPLCIAGERFNVLFDGQKVTLPEFPSEPIEYTAPCGTRISQTMMVLICKKKLNLI